MEPKALRRLLLQYRAGRLSTEKLCGHLKDLPYKELSFAKVDTHRALRRKFPEVIYAKGKSAPQVIAVAEVLRANGSSVLATKVTPALGRAMEKALPWIRYFPQGQMASGPAPSRRRGGKEIPVVTAGTTDIPVAEEAALTLELMGFGVKRIFDVGVAGLHRILSKRRHLWAAPVIVVAAGMDGVLPSVVSGLVAVPVVAVPTSVGYGASFKGVAPLLTMLNSCSPGVAVVNIDNGFGAGYLAAMIARRR